MLAQDLQLKPSLNVTAIRRFNSPVVLLAPNFWRLSSSTEPPRAGGILNTSLQLSNFGDRSYAKHETRLHWRVMLGGKTVCQDSQMMGPIALGKLTPSVFISCGIPTMAHDAAPLPVTLSASVDLVAGTGGSLATNEWEHMLSVFPEYVHRPAAFEVYTSGIGPTQCPYSSCRALKNDSVLAPNAVVLSAANLSPVALAAASRGATLVIAAGVAAAAATPDWICPTSFPFPAKGGSHNADRICYNESRFADKVEGPCGSWCSDDPHCGNCRGPSCTFIICSTASERRASSFAHMLEKSSFGESVWNYGPSNTGTVVYKEATRIFNGSVQVNMPLLGDWALQIGTGAHTIVDVDKLTNISGLPVANVSVLVRSLDATYPKGYADGLDKGFRSKAYLLKAHLVGGGTVLAFSFDIMQDVVTSTSATTATPGTVNAQSAWLLQRLLQYASERH